MPSAFHRGICPIFSALLACAVYVGIHRGLIEITADGWAYWQGAVSLLAGKGYSYFSGLDLDDWPPLYSLYLAAWVWLFGPSGNALLIANGALTALQAAGWLLLARSLAGTRAWPPSWKEVTAAFYLGLFIPIWEQPALAHNLLYTILPYQGLATLAAVRSKGLGVGAFGSVLAASALLAITHNSGLVFVAASAAVIFVLSKRSWGARFLMAVFATLVPAGAWYAVRLYLHQEESHPLGAGRFTVLQYIGQGISGAGDLFLPPLLPYAGAVLMALLAAWTAYRLRLDRVAVMFVLIMTAVPFVLLQAVFNITWVTDPLSDARFSLFIPLMLLPMSFLAANSHKATVILAAVTLPVLAVRLVNAGHAAGRPEFPHAVPANYTISWILSPGQRVTSKNGEVLFGPPLFDWEIPGEEDGKD